ncbi:helix-turn-helix domain-containing protein [Bartonella sp. B41]
MLTSFGKILRELRIDRLERLFDMSKKLGISSAFLSSIEIGKRSIPVGMEEKIIELYALDKEIEVLLRKEADSCRKIFAMNRSDSLNHQTTGMFDKVISDLLREDLKIEGINGKNW